MKPVFSNDCFLTKSCFCIFLALMVSAADDQRSALDDLATSGSDTNWQTRAAATIGTLTTLADASPQVEPPTSYSDLKRHPDLRRISTSGEPATLARHSVDRVLWDLWLLTGMPPLDERQNETTREYLRRNTQAYREYVAKHTALSEEALHRLGLANAVDAIGSPLWYMALKYIGAKASLEHDWIIDVRTTPSSLLVRCPLDPSAYPEFSAAMSSWLKVNERRMIWSQRERRFLPNSGEYLGTDRLLAVIASGMGRTDNKASSAKRRQSR